MVWAGDIGFWDAPSAAVAKENSGELCPQVWPVGVGAGFHAPFISLALIDCRIIRGVSAVLRLDFLAVEIKNI